jgi:hypothetical protein
LILVNQNQHKINAMMVSNNDENVVESEDSKDSVQAKLADTN